MTEGFPETLKKDVFIHCGDIKEIDGALVAPQKLNPGSLVVLEPADDSGVCFREVILVKGKISMTTLYQMENGFPKVTEIYDYDYLRTQSGYRVSMTEGQNEKSFALPIQHSQQLSHKTVVGEPYAGEDTEGPKLAPKVWTRPNDIFPERVVNNYFKKAFAAAQAYVMALPCGHRGSYVPEASASLI
jgi:hypothetical protein